MHDEMDKYGIQFRKYKARVEETFDAEGRSVYLLSALERLILNNRDAWKIGRVPVTVIVELLQNESHLAIVNLASDSYDALKRFAWRDPSPFELVLSIRKDSYLSHASAISMHALTDDVPAVFYANKEQSAKGFEAHLTQGGIDRAFANRPRQSNYVFTDGVGRRYFGLNGKWTGRLEVVELIGPEGQTLPVTSLERTLIDIVVRPAYAGGVVKVLEAYRAARERVSVNLLLAVLRKIGHAYPYHQAIGFYMQRADYSPAALDLVKKEPREFDFYLTNQMKEKVYDADWRIHYPAGL